jgi:signal transduction histidine kinase
MFAFMEADLVFIHGFLNDLSLSERKKFMKDVNRGFYDISLKQGEIQNPIIPRTIFIEIYKVSDRISELIHIEPSNLIFVGPVDNSSPALILHLSHGQYLQVVATEPLPTLSLAGNIVFLLTIFLSVSLLVWLAIKLVMQPLDVFVRTTEQLGRNLNTPLFDQKGLYEVRNVVLVLDKMRKRILGEIDRHTQMLAAISHDMQTPITKTLLRAEKITDIELQDKIKNELYFMSDLISETVEYGRTSALNFTPVPLDLDALVQMIVDGELDIGHNVRLKGSIKTPVLGSLNDLRRAIQNVVDNAIKYTSETRIELCKNEKYASIFIRDNGPGIDEMVIKKIHKPFYRGEASRGRKSGGTGLGLSNTFNIIKAHNGEVIIKNMSEGLEVEIRILYVDKT